MVPVPSEDRAIAEVLAKSRQGTHPSPRSASRSVALTLHFQEAPWVPAYEGARAFVEMRHSLDPIVHLLHPRPVSWHTLLAPIAQELDVPLVPFTEWLSRLEGSVAQGSAEGVKTMGLNAALRLLSLYKARGEIVDRTLGVDVMGFATIGTDKAVRVSESLASLPQLDGETAMRWLVAWRKSGFLPRQEPTSWKGKL